MGDRLPGEAEAKRQFADRLRTLRKQAGLTQIELGALAAVDRRFVTKLEKGRTSPTLWTIVRFAWALDVDTCALVGGLRPNVDHPTRPAPT